MRPPSFPGRGGEARGGMAEPAPGECAKGVNEIEGYLLWQAETAAAREHGIDRLENVSLAVLEVDGSISVIGPAARAGEPDAV